MRPIDANTLSDEISRLQIFLGGEILFTPAIKETVLRTIDEQATIAISQPDNAPLTLEELREMDGEPVWVEFYSKTSKTGKWSGWALVDIRFDDMEFMEEHRLKIKYYGKSWLAYRRKPEPEGGDR